MDYLMNVVSESPVSTMMYHGSDLKLDSLKPTAYNAGHRLKSHSWSVFLWPTYELAYKWAAFVTCRNLGRALKGKIDKWRPLGEHIKTGYNKYDFKVRIHEDAYDAVKKFVCKDAPKFYVYTVDTPIDTKLSIGNNNIQPEYSYDGDLDIYHQDEYQLTENLFEEIFEPCDEATYKRLKAFKGENIRGPIGVLFHPSDDVMKRWSFVYKRIQKGTVKPGDDLDPIIAEYEQNEDITHQRIWVSQDDIYLNYEDWKNGNSHALIIVGLSGSGKSTLGRKIAEESEAVYVELDVLSFEITSRKNADKGRNTFEYIRERDPMLYKFFKAYNIPPDVFTDIPRPIRIEDIDRIEEMNGRYIHWLVFEQKEKVVIEGVTACKTLSDNAELYQDTPVIFKGTSVAKSVLRRIWRSITQYHSPLGVLRTLRGVGPMYDTLVPKVNDARKALLDNRTDYELVKEDLIDEDSSPYHIKFKRSTDGLLNPITTINGRDYRPRAEILLLDENNNLLIRKHEGINQYGTTYKLPGGGFDNPGETPEDVAYRECCEEVRIIPKDVVFSDIIYVVEYGDRIPEWHKKKLWPSGIKYVGAVSFVCVGRYDKKYHKYVRKIDQEPSMEEFKFYPIDSLSHILRDEHKQAIRDYLTHTEGAMKFGELDIDAPNPHVKHKKHKISVPSNIKDFKDFCAKIPNPEVSMAWFIKNKVKWTPHGGSNDHPFQWPDYLIKQKMGNCFDQTIFMHYYCQKKRIDHRMFLITWISDKGEGTGHAVPMYMKGKYVYIWLYFRPGVGTIAGPYRSYEEAKTTLDYYFSVAMNRLFKSPTYAYSSFISNEDMARFDEYYNDRSITQTQYICDGLGANLRSTHMVKLKYKGFTFPNPAVPIYDVVITAIQLLKFANSLIPMKEAVEELYRKRILLTSAGLENPVVRGVFDKYLGCDPKDAKVLFVTAAAIDKESKSMIPECIEDLVMSGIRPTNLVEYNFDHAISVDELCEYQVIYVCGGDENHLMKVINRAKMRSNLIEAVEQGLFYVGVSAGACIGSSYVDDGLEFVPNKVDVHYDDHKCTKDGYLPPNNVQINLSNKQAVWICDDNAVIIGMDNTRTVYEDTDLIDEIYLDRDIDKSMDPLRLNPAKDYRDFNDFCSKVHTIPMMLKWFIDNVSWPDPIVDLRITWPDELVKTKIGMCFDHAVFMHYFCKRLGLASRLMQVLWTDKDDKFLGGHVGIVFRYRDKYYTPIFLPKCGWIVGPYNTWDDARLNFQQVMEGYGNYYVRHPTYTYSVLLEDEDHRVLDRYYNKPSTQDIFDGCTSLTYYRLHYKGYSAPDPMVWVADVMKAAAERILYHREKSWVESVEESGADSKYTKSYRDFNEFCANIHTPYEVLNWYRVNFVRWNSPDKDGHLNRKPFTWPDDMIKTKIGNCGDHAIFMHYFCERHHIPNYIIRLTRNWLTRDSNEYHIGQHFTCVFKDDAGWFGFDYSGGPMRDDRARFYSKHSALSGPYPSAEAYAEESARIMDHTMSRMGLANLRKVEKCEYHFLTKENLELLDRLYGRHDVMQIDYYMMIRKDIQSKYDFKTYEEDDPIDWAMNKIQLGLYKAKSLITHEDTMLINEDKKMDKTQLVKTFKSIKTFDDFCKVVPNPEAMLLWFIYNRVEWHVDDNKHPIQWPDDIIATKKGICLDHAIFMHYYCERKRIPNRIMFMSWVPDKGKITGHAILIYEYKGQYYSPIYMSKGYGWMTGPYRSWEEARQNLHEIHAGAVAYYGSRSPVTPYSSLLDDRDMRVLDEYYGRHDVTSQQVLEKFRSSHLYKLRFRGMLFPNPLLFFEDLFGQLYHKLSRARGDYWGWNEDTNLITEAKDIYVDRFGNKKAKGDSIYIGTDANASESEYLKRVEYIRLSTIRNGTPQPVIMKNGGSYRARCEVIVLKGNKILLDRGKNRGGFGYTLPGGGIDPREKVAKGAARECEEEALVKPKHVKFMDVVWWGEFENPLFNKGSVSMVCVAEFGSYYDESKVKQEDRDEFADRAQWEDYRTAKLGEPHMIAIERYFGRDVKPKLICTLEETITEAKLKPEERTNYGLPKKKKYPMPDEAHVLQAIRMFNHCDPEDEEELARNIIKNMKKYNMKDVKVGKNNRFHKYYHPDKKTLDESLRMESYKIIAFINESIRLLEMAGGGGPVIGMEINDQSVQFSTPGQFLINFSDTPDTRKNDYAISNDLSSKYIYRKKKDKYIKEDATTFLKDKTIRIYRFLGEQSLWLTLLRDIDINICDEETSVYEDLTGKKELSYDQIDYDDSFEYFDLSKYLLESSMFKTTVDLETAKLHGDKRYEFILPNQDLSKRYIIKEDQKGQFLYDQLTGNRSPSLTKG